MKLRTQLLLVVGLVLIVPLVVGLALLDLLNLLRDREIDQLDFQSEIVAQHLVNSSASERLSFSVNPSTDLFANTVDHELTVDGYPGESYVNVNQKQLFQASISVDGYGNDTQIELQSAVSKNYVYLHFLIKDDELTLHDPNTGRISSGDRLSLYIGDTNNDITHYLLRIIAPGKVNGLVEIGNDRTQEKGRFIVDRHILAYWVPVKEGYSIEIRLPKPPSGGKFAFAFFDIDGDHSIGEAVTVNTTQSTQDGRLVYVSKAMENHLRNAVYPGFRTRVFNKNGITLLDINRQDEILSDSATSTSESVALSDLLLYRLFEFWYSDYSLLSPVEFSEFENQKESGLTLLNQSELPWLSLGSDLYGTIQAVDLEGQPRVFVLTQKDQVLSDMHIGGTLARMLGRLLLVFSVVMLALLMYASWLSVRIRKIGVATANALDDKGRIKSSIPGNKAKDELGELSRNITQLLGRLSSHTEYLQTLTSKLSHELRTPLAVVSTSLENMEQKDLSDVNRTLISRAQIGTQRLQGLIRTLSEATHLEQIVANPVFEKLDLRVWLDAMGQVYQGIYPTHTIEFVDHSLSGLAEIEGSPELLQQMLDKLVSNAIEFTPASGFIELSLHEQGGVYSIQVFNSGATLDPAVKDNLFDALVSARSYNQDEHPHLGIGLYIVRLIASAHNAVVSADEDEKRKGVVIEICFQPPQ